MEKRKTSISKSFWEFTDKYNDFIDAIHEQINDAPSVENRTEDEERLIDELTKQSITARKSVDAMVKLLGRLGLWDGNERMPAERKFMNTTHEKLCKREAINEN